MQRRVLLMISSMRGGGSERQVLLLLRHLDRQKFAPELYVTEPVGDLMSLVPSDVPVHAYEDTARFGGLYWPGRALSRQVHFLRDLIRDRDIDVVYDRTFHMSLIAGPAAKAIGVPRISTIVSPPELALPAVETKFVWLKRRRLARAYRDSRTVVAVSRQAAASAESYYDLPTAAIQVIPNPVDVEQLRTDAAAGSLDDENDDRLTMVCVGRMTAEKGHHDLITAIELAETNWGAELPSLRLLMIGDGPLRAELQGRCSSRSERHQIEFLGVQANPAPFIAAADALVLPSHFEGMPNVVLEAMALGTPVIATRCGGTVELEHDQPTILWADPQHPPSLAAALISFAKDPHSARVRAQNAQVMIDQYHDVHNTTRQIEALLQ